MGKFDELTKYIPLIENEFFGKWISDNENDGTLKCPIKAPFASYSETVYSFIKDLYKFCDTHSEYEYTRYRDILEANGLNWKPTSMKEANVSEKDSKCVVALLIGATRAERFCEGVLLNFFAKGIILRWLERLKEIDDKE